MYSMNRSSHRRLAILSFIRDRVEADGRPPSLAEIAQACGLASRSAAQKHVKALQASGQLEASLGKARSARPKTAPKVTSDGAATFFEVTPAHIGALSDTDLRELVARLCMARLAVAGHPPEYVIWGGDQRAADGGIDVRVQMPAEVAVTAGFPRARIGLQVKAMRMPESEIQKEMCPGGMLRTSIRDLVRAHGAYIIASSETRADKPYQDRVSAMKSAAATVEGADNAEFDFYDARRLTNWTNQHPGIVAWVRSRLGNPLQGWRPYGQWANTRGAKSQPFLEDDTPRLIDPTDPERKHSLVDGLQYVRSLLRAGGSSVRIAGLSGVGKTRFVQALFEESAAQNALVPELAVYTDTADSPVPPPLALLDELLANGRGAVLIVDNCASQLHSQLTARCKASNRVSLLTIEYDIREDIPNETSVFRLEPGSTELIEKVIGQQFPHISQVNVATIGRFAEGNSRVAIALANTLDQKDSLAGIGDKALFERLFWQRGEVDSDLMNAAQVCALVYSFNVEDSDTELPQLASLADMSSLALYRHIDELFRRGLAQKRGPWRAVLPHAIANTLASRALSATPYSVIASNLIEGHGRLLRSFSRRLSYLHESLDAVAIVQRWFAHGNLLADLTNLADPLVDVLQNVAPVDPEATLLAIERAASGDHASEFISTNNFMRTRIVRLLRSIAWDAKYFERCLDVMVRFALAESEDNRNDSTRGVIESLFALYLSGTRATLEQRLTWITRALRNEDPLLQRIGVQCLKTALEAHHFTSFYGFEFGARPRDYGISPRGKEVREWFTAIIELATEIGVEPTNIGSQVRSVLADRFRSLWAVAGMVDALEQATPRFLELGWEKGWLAIKQTIRFDAAGMPEDIQERLKALESLSRPQTLIARTKAIVLNSFSGGLDITDGDEHGSQAYERADQAARELGELVVVERETLDALLPLLVENQQGRQWMFGAGMAAAADDPSGTWDKLVEAFESIPDDKRNIQILRGFLNGVHGRDRELFERLMDATISNKSLVMWVPVLQLSSELDDGGCSRLLRSMDDPAVPAWVFQYLGHGRATEALSDEALSRLLERLARKPDGLEVAIDVLSMHIFDNPSPIGPELARLARELLGQFSPSRNSRNLDFALRKLIQKFLCGPEGELHARLLLRKIHRGLDDYSLSPYDIDDAVAALFETQPIAALDELVGDESDDGAHYARRRELRADHAKNALSGVPLDTLVKWCEAGGEHRWEHVAAVIPAFDRDDQERDLHWSQSVADLLKRAPDAIRVAGILVERIEPMSWSGSRAEIISSRMSLIDELEVLLGNDATGKVCQWRSYFQRMMERERQRELEEHRRENERFE